MKFFLIIFLSFHTDGGVGSQKIEFSTMRDCEAAKSQILSDFSEAKISSGLWSRISISCIQGGKS